MNEPGPLLASGRDSDIFEYGDGLVLRRSRRGRSMATEARVMEYVREHGFPAPRVHELSDDGTELVMERVDGPSMLEVLGARPWTIRRMGFVLGTLHNSLHHIPGPEWVRASPVGVGDELVHLDLHPGNVLISAVGPVVIDWANVARGDGNADAALSWLLMSAGTVDAGSVKSALLELARSRMIKAFLKRFDRAKVAARMPAVVAWKLSDPNMSEVEQVAMRALLAKELFSR
ncbi:MAG TPA: phosphotransferase [Acidimicrobiales bacterium]|jgi:aminoglycoside phosphotransferase (APT) family kinase protein|nr:phosphotransferase [Acidimicrobiales bacterium]